MFFERQPSFAAEPGVSDKEIIIGATTALSGPAAGIGNLISKIGAETYFKHINETGGINGRRITYQVLDDGHLPARAVQNVRTLIERDNVFCLFANFGTSVNLALTSLLGQYKTPLFSPISLSKMLTDPLNYYIFDLYPNYFIQAHKIVAYSKSISKRVAIIYEDNINGAEGHAGTVAAIKDTPLKLVGEIKILIGEMDFSPHISQLMNLKEKPDTVILFIHEIQAARILIQSQQMKFNPKFISVIPLLKQDFIKTTGNAAEGTVALTIVPDAETSPKQGVIEYRKHLKKYFPEQEPTTESLIGYTSAKVLVETLKRTGKEITRDKFIKTLEEMKKYETNIIYPVSFSPENRLGTKCPFFNKIIDGKFQDFKGDCGGDG
jgi:ABC-type branched-subunit amino acid transport system substrate-binding protein